MLKNKYTNQSINKINKVKNEYRNREIHKWKKDSETGWAEIMRMVAEQRVRIEGTWNQCFE